ncbi:MAG: 16S rRNA (cytidine(1402)-2'-O)-methyltransferase [Cyanothece sp. SIO2G6]|nr:16S rRNA (cytidine(1402)-2'-O)-methyltransferase [Cyanothece sp. SIO2G6]
MEIEAGTLYIVGTPIGNLEDMTFRAIQVLQSVSLIAAEDTRHTGKLLKHFQVATPQISYHEHNRRSRIPALIQRLEAGDAIALVTDAGMPGVSDPGGELVAACCRARITVVPIPGPTAAITALSASGLSPDRFVFEGFLPAKGTMRRDRLTSLATESRTMLLYESPHRLRKTLVDLEQTLGGERPIVLARELTKLHETFWRGSIAQAISYYANHDPKGEFTLVVAGFVPNQREWTDAEIKAELAQQLQQGRSLSQASRQLAAATHLSRRMIYQLALTLPELQPELQPESKSESKSESNDASTAVMDQKLIDEQMDES